MIDRLWDSEEPNERLEVTIRQAARVPDADDGTEFHAARLLLLLYHAGGPRKKSIQGRTKLAKLDFLIRYPTYLIKAARIKNVFTNLAPVARPESRMIRFKYGPWDESYYNTFSYLVAKDFVSIHSTRKGDIFHLTEKGKTAAEELSGSEFEEIIERCKLAYELFGLASGTSIKDFIYEQFPEVVARPLGEEIVESHG